MHKQNPTCFSTFRNLLRKSQISQSGSNSPTFTTGPATKLKFQNRQSKSEDTNTKVNIVDVCNDSIFVIFANVLHYISLI